ncbi:galactose oxidase [Phanerochaete sordida]|uniref:Galactose oxidase n=1 Tax=Phanerochaete sordida TaxID=48140 RepID=A0A9P3FY89_9APHY|nr:galactose oxidase [Phanerochaete sordida]
MAKKKDAKVSKKAAKAAKQAAIQKKVERKEKKKSAKDESDTEDLEAILDQMRREWEDKHKVTEELVEGPPSRRANATLTPCPNGNHLWCIGGEFFSEDGRAYFYNDVFRYSPEKDEWRKFVSPNCPGPRSAHAVVPSPAGGGKLFLFGGEFSSLHQTTFHHYRDFWCFDIQTHSWDRIETKILPSARSGHRMALWKHYIVLFGGFYDPGIRTNYLNDLWLFDTQEYKWKQAEFKENERKPSPRSGFSFLSTPEGILLHGGYCKEYHKGKRPIGVMLEDTWFLSLSLPTEKEGTSTKQSASTFNMPVMKWERRKRPATAYAPSLRSGCTMTLWQTRNTGILFGGVTDEDTNEETLESVFHNDLYGYQIPGNGRWVSLALKKPKKKGTTKKKKAQAQASTPKANLKEKEKLDPGSGEERDPDEYYSDEDGPKPWEVAKQQQEQQKQEAAPSPHPSLVPSTPGSDEENPDDPDQTIPLPRYNAMLAVLRNNLFIYGGIFEQGSREYTLDDFHSIALDKLDRYVCLKPTDVVIPKDAPESSSDEGSDSEGSDGSESENSDDDGDARGTQGLAAANVESEDEPEKAVPEEEPEQDSLRAQATAFMGVARDQTRSAEDVVSTPLPGETLAMFYARSREYWAGKAHESSDNRGKMLRRDGFTRAQERYKEYKPILQEVEKILAEAGLDEEEMRRSAAAGPDARKGENRNRR